MSLRRGEVPHTVKNNPRSQATGFSRVLGTSLGASRGTVLYDLAGVGKDDDPGEERTESRAQQPVYGSLGVYSRPPTTPEDGDVAETVNARVGDESLPVGAKDPRQLKWVNRGAPFVLPRDKEQLFCGHGGSFISTLRRETANGPEDDLMIRVPYDRSANGAPTKSDVVTIGRGGDGVRAIDVRSGDGAAVTIRQGKITLTAPSGSVSIELSNDGIKALASAINLFGGVSLGGPTAEPLVKFAPNTNILTLIVQALAAAAGSGTAPGSPLAPLSTAMVAPMTALSAAMTAYALIGQTLNVKAQ